MKDEQVSSRDMSTVPGDEKDMLKPVFHPDVFSLKIRKEFKGPVIISAICGGVMLVSGVLVQRYLEPISLNYLWILLGLSSLFVLPAWLAFAAKLWFLRRARERARASWEQDEEGARAQMHAYLAQRERQEIVTSALHKKERKITFGVLGVMGGGLVIASAMFAAGLQTGGLMALVWSGLGFIEAVGLLLFLVMEYKMRRHRNRLASIREERKLIMELRHLSSDKKEALTGGLSLSSNEQDRGGRLSLNKEEPGGSEHHGERGRE